MSDDSNLLTAADLDTMSPDQRARVFGESMVASLDELPPGFRSQIEQTARCLAAQRAPRTDA